MNIRKNKKPRPLVSICCWTYNHKKYIAKAVKGFLSQKTDFPFEIIIHDDASTDGTNRALLNITKKTKVPIKLMLSKTNQYSKKGSLFLEPIFKRAKGKYIAFCEGDDFWGDERKLQKQVACLEKNKTAVMCGHDAMVVDSKGKVIKGSLLPDWAKKDFSSWECQIGATYIQTCTLMVRNKIKNLPTEIGRVINADNFLTSYLGRFGNYKFCTDVKKSFYRQHEGGIWTSMDPAMKIFSQNVTFFWLIRFYEKEKNNQLAKFYKSKLEGCCELFLIKCGWVGLMAPTIGYFLYRLKNKILEKISKEFKKIIKISAKIKKAQLAQIKKERKAKYK